MRQCNWMSEQGLWCWWRRLNVRIKDWTRVVCAVSSHVHGGVTIAFQTLETYHLLNQNLKKRRKKKDKKKDIKEGGLLGRVWARWGFMCRTVLRLPSDGAVRGFWRWSGNIAAVSGRKKMPPHSDVSWKERSPAVSYSSQTPCARLPGFHQHTLLKWQRSCQKPERPKRSIMHVHSRLGSPSQDSTFQLST